MLGKLVLVATPIGNLKDITLRAAEELRNADFIIAEDTRVTSVLLSHLGISAKLISCNGFTEEGKCESLAARIAQGECAAMVTDAGMPCVSDPGYRMVRAALAAGAEVTVCPGACAAVTAIAISGLPSASFAFYGFLPRKRGEIIARLSEIDKDAALLAVFYEAPSRIQALLECINEVFPTARLAVCNDLTKKFERVYRGNVAEVSEQLAENPKSEKGEYTVVVEKRNDKAIQNEFCTEALLVQAMVTEKVSIKEAISIAAKQNKLSKKELYAASLNLKALFDAGETKEGEPKNE